MSPHHPHRAESRSTHQLNGTEGPGSGNPLHGDSSCAPVLLRHLGDGDTLPWGRGDSCLCPARPACALSAPCACPPCALSVPCSCRLCPARALLCPVRAPSLPCLTCPCPARVLPVLLARIPLPTALPSSGPGPNPAPAPAPAPARSDSSGRSRRERKTPPGPARPGTARGGRQGRRRRRG